MLYLIKELIPTSKEGQKLGFTEAKEQWIKLVNLLSQRILVAYNKAYLNMSHYELERLQKLFHLDGDFDSKLTPYIKRNLSIATEIKEVLILTTGIKLRLLSIENDEGFIDSVNDANDLVSGSNTIRNKYIRNLELNLANDLYERLYEEKNLPEDKKEDLIIKALKSQLESIKARNIFGLSYIHNHSIMAFAYSRLFEWVKRFQELTKNKKVDKPLSQFFEKEVSNELDKSYLEGKIEEHNYKCIQTHHQGAAYRKFIGEMYYLDDDFNDNLFHFCAALERMKINAGVITSKLSESQLKTNEGFKDNEYLNSFFSEK